MDLYLIPPEEALRLMEQERTCPPLDMLMQGGPDIDKHLKDCPSCRILARQDRKKYAELDAFLRSRPSPEPGGRVQAGEVRQISRSAVPDIHNEQGWHNPPLALVIYDEDAVGIPGVVRVAPLFNMPSLAFIGDIPLRSLKKNLFAESWNTFALPARCLAGVIGVAARKELDDVREWENRELPELAEGTAQLAFRRLERKIAGFYGKHGAAQALAMWEGESSAQKKTSGGATVHVFRRGNGPANHSDIRRAVDACRHAVYETASAVQDERRYADAADAPLISMEEHDRDSLNRIYGPMTKGVVNVYTLDFGSRDSSREERPAEFRFSKDEKAAFLNVLLPWDENIPLWEAAVMLSEDTPERWMNIDMEELEGCVSLFLKLDEGTLPDTSCMKVLLFAGKKV